MMEKLLNLLNDLRPDIDYEKEDLLVDGGFLDSFDIVTIIADISKVFSVEIKGEDFIPENFNSAKAMLELIKKRSSTEI